MMKVSQAVLDRFKIASTVISAIDFHAVEVVGTLQDVFVSSGTQEAFDVERLLYAHRDLLIRVRERMRRADENLLAEAGDDKEYRDARDEAVACVSQVLSDVCLMLEAAYDHSLLTFYGLNKEIPRAPEHLHVYAKKVVMCLRERPLEQKSPFGFDLDMVLLAGKIETELVLLSQALAHVEREVAEIQDALCRRHDAMAAFDATYESVASLICAYFTLAKRPDLAELVRPTSRRRHGTPEVADLTERSAVELDAELAQA